MRTQPEKSNVVATAANLRKNIRTLCHRKNLTSSEIMAKSLLLNILVDVLGNYVEGLSKENLKVAVWNGTIDLYNLKLKATALDKLNLPIKVERGYLKKLHLKIPWASLESKPVIAELDGIYLQAGPIDLSKLSPEESQRMITASKQSKFEEAEREILRVIQKKEDLQATAKKATYVQQLTAKIIDNLEVTLTNLHIRYEDSTSIPGSIFSCGMTIESLSLATTDENWSSSFVNRDITKRKETSINKLGTMENLGVYWNTSNEPLRSCSFREWEAQMQARIFRANVEPAEQSPRSPDSVLALPNVAESMTYLLAPPNQFSMKVTHREVCTETQPKVDVKMRSTTIPFKIHSDQYQQLSLVSREFQDIDRRKLLITHRPKLRPTKAPREWWLYAFHLLTGKKLTGTGDSKMNLLRECVRGKKLYVPYVRRKIMYRELIEPLLVDAEQVPNTAHSKTDAEMRLFQDILPLSTLIVFHQIAAKEAVIEILRLRADPALLKAYIDKKAPGLQKPESKGFWGGSTSTPVKGPSSSTAGAPLASSSSFFGSLFGTSKPKAPSSPVPARAADAVLDKSGHGPAAKGRAGSPGGVLQKAASRAEEKELAHGHVSSSELDEDESLMEELQSTLNKYSAEATAAQDALFTLRVKIDTSAVLSVVLHKQPVIYTIMSMHSKIEMRKSNLSVLFDVDNFSVQDTITVNPVYPNLVCMLDSQEHTLASSIQATTPAPPGSDALSSPVVSIKPKFCFAFESCNGKSTLKIKSSPVQIVCNEPCVQALMTCFVSPVSQYRTEAPLLLTSMNAISSAVTLSDQGGMEIDMEIYAPTIIIPEEYDADRGCVQLDTGKLLVHGTMNNAGMVWSVNVRAVNIGMPRKGTVSTKQAPRLVSQDSTSTLAASVVPPASVNDDVYLITPFDINITVKMEKEAECDMAIAMQIEPYIAGQLDALKLIRLKYILDVVLRSMQPLPPPEEVEDEASPPARNRRRLIYDEDEDVVAMRPPVFSNTIDVDYKRVKMDLSIVLPRMAVLLTMNAGHTIELALSAIDLKVVRRAGDMNVLINAESLVMTDSKRPEAHRAILWTVGSTHDPVSQSGEKASSSDAHGHSHIIPSGSTAPLFRLSYRMLSTPLSPLYNGNQTELSVVCSSLRCGIDAASISRYVPFTSELIAHNHHYYGLHDEKSPISSQNNAAVSSSAAVRRKQAVQSESFGGSQTILSIAQFSVDLLREQNDGSTTNTKKKGAARTESVLECAFSTEISDIFLQYNAKSTANDINAHIAAIEIKDVRPSSAAFVYNTLFTRNVVSQLLSSEGLTTQESMSDKILSVKFNKDLNSLITTIEVYLQDITSYVSLDIINAFVDLILSNLNAVNEVLVAIHGEQDISELIMQRLKSLQVASQGGNAAGNKISSSGNVDAIRRSSVGGDTRGSICVNKGATAPGNMFAHDELAIAADELKECMNLTVTVVNPRLLLLENPENSATKAIVSDCFIVFRFAQEKTTSKSDSRCEVRDTFHCSLQRAQVFVLLNVLENRNPHKIIAPTGMDVHAKRHSESGIVLSSSLVVGSEPIMCRVSLNDVVLTNTILARSKLTPRESKPSASSNANTVATKKNTEARSLTLRVVQFNIAKVSVILLNDYRDLNLPLFRLVVDELKYNSSGAVTRMDGEGSLVATVDYYNSYVAVWEPILEYWNPSVRMRRDSNGFELAFTSRGTMQMNVTGSMCTCLYTCMSLLSKIGQEGLSTERKKTEALVVRNFLGVEVELVNHRSGQSITVLQDDAPYAIPPLSGAGTSPMKQGSYKVDEYPDTFDLRLTAPISGPRSPIVKIPIRSSRSKLYHFYPETARNSGMTPTKNLQSEPVVEEVFENMRYQPMKFSWGEPWSNLGDPPKWTDVRGQPSREPNKFALPNGWEWLDHQWSVDVGAVGSETDKDGWYYGVNFTSFTASRKNRRAQQPLDVVRRRRWVRTRMLKRSTESAVLKEDQRPIPVFWDVLVKSDESSEIHISSGYGVHNNSPCPLEIELIDPQVQGGGWAKLWKVGMNDTLQLPYTAVHSTMFRVRPQGGEYAWSEAFSSRLKIDETNPNLFSVSRAVCGRLNHGGYHFVVHVQQRNKRVTITVSGSAQFFNKLPTPLSVLCSTREGGVDSEVLEPGANFCVSKVSVDANMEISFALGDYASVQPVKVAHLSNNPELIIWLRNREEIVGGDATPDLLSVTIKSVMSSVGVLEITTYSQYLLIDQSDSAVLVRTDTSDSSSPASSHARAGSDLVTRRTYQNEVKNVRKPIVQQIQSMESISIDKCWAKGLGGVTMFHSSAENKISLGVNGGSGWLKDLSLDALNMTKTPVEIVDPNSATVCNFALTLTPMPGPLSATHVLRVLPCYTIVNHTGEAIDFMHPTNKPTEDKSFVVEAKSGRTWHRPKAAPGTAVRLRSESTVPSIGVVDINEIGATLVLLPLKDATSEGNFVVLHVEVKFSEPTEASYITVVIWKAEMQSLNDGSIHNGKAGLSIKNETDCDVAILQDGVEPLLQTLPPAVAKKCELLLHPGEWRPYGWVDSAVGSSLVVTIRSGAGNQMQCVVNTLLVNTIQTIGNVLSVEIKTIGNGKVLFLTSQPVRGSMRIPVGDSAKIPSSPTSSNVSNSNKPEEGELRSNDTILKFRFQSIGLSLVAETPKRRELFSCYLEDLESHVRMVPQSEFENRMTSLDVKVKDIQMDNFTDSCIYPVLINSINSDQRLQAAKRARRQAPRPSEKAESTTDLAAATEETDNLDQEYRPFLRFSVMWEVPRGQHTVVVKYLAIRVLELKVALDTSTIFLYFLDLHKDLVQDPYFIDTSDPHGLQTYLTEFNSKILDQQLHHVNNADADPEHAYVQAQAHKYFFEALVVHPMKITLTFTPASVPASRAKDAASEFGGNNKLRLLPKVAAVEDFEIKISSFIVDHAMESILSLQQRIIAKTLTDLKSEMLQIAGNLVGSMTMLGKPAGLYKNIGGGVSDFFYEPYLGIMESPQAFVLGLSKGTGSLIHGVASGVLGSAANIVGTATSGVSTLAEGVANLSGDDKYLKRREEKLRAAKANQGQGGVLSGLQAGGESIFTGVTSGISGLVTKPYQEGKKSGALGVVKGMGMGVLGVVAKPVMGVSDGISSIATGFHQQIQDPKSVVSRIRPARAFEKTDTSDDAPVVLNNLDIFAAEAQEYVMHRTITHGYSDEYLCSCTLGFPRFSNRSAEAPFGIALGKVYVFLLTRSINKIWKLPFSELSHVVLKFTENNQGGVEFVRYSDGGSGRGAAAQAAEAMSRYTNSSKSSYSGDSELVLCASRAAAIRLYSMMARFAYRMGNPAAVTPLEELLETTTSSFGDSVSSRTQSMRIVDPLSPSKTSSALGNGYKFGSVNLREYSPEFGSEAQIFEQIQARLAGICLTMLAEPGGADKYNMLLDDTLWRLVCEWRGLHHVVFNPSRCAACLVINNTPHYVQINEVELKEGKDFLIMGAGDGYDKDSRSLVANGGAVILFAYGYVPSLTDLAHVKLRVFTSAFTAVISTRKNRTEIANQNGFHAGYAEKVQSDYWSKSVITIN